MPLNIWTCPDGPTPGQAARRSLAERVVTEYVPEGGTVLDLAPGRGELVRAAKDVRRNVIALPTTVRQCTGGAAPRQAARRVVDVLGAVEPLDAAVLLPPAERLAPPYRRFALSRPAQHALLTALAPVVREGGFVALASLGDPTAPASATEAADAAGLAYFQHVVALLVPTARLALRTHVDVVVFTRRSA